MRKSVITLAILLGSVSTLASASSILNGVTVNLNWVFPTSSNVYQSYVPNTVGSGTEFLACPAPTYTCSGAGSPNGTALGSVPNNAISVDVSDVSDLITLNGADNEDNTFFGNAGVGGINGYAVSIDEASALALLGENVYFTGASIQSSSGVWTGGDTPSIFLVNPTTIFVNFSGLPSGPTTGCSGFEDNTPCGSNPTGTANSVVVQFTTEGVAPPVPEPGTMLLVGAGVAGLLRKLAK